MRIKVDESIMPPKELIAKLGVDAKGRVQEYLTQRVLFRMRRYMPWLTGHTATDLTQMTSPTTITVSAPYARRLYEGVTEQGTPLSYTRITNPLAGPRWDETLVANEGAAIARETEDYAKGLL